MLQFVTDRLSYCGPWSPERHIMKNLIHQAIPGFVATIVGEFVASKVAGKEVYEVSDAATSIGMGLSNVFFEAIQGPLTKRLNRWFYEHRLMDFPLRGAARKVACIVVDDFFYYWFHRYSHEMRVFWAAHVNHHSSEHYNLATALRQSWATPWTKIPFWVPMALMGFDEEEIEWAHHVNLLYQYWVHTELIDNLGPFEEVMSTPSHHRVHHGSNLRYLDKNYGGIFIVWDRLFGTFEREDAAEPVRYGILHNLGTNNIWVAATHEWSSMLADAGRRSGLVNKLRTFWSAPGWSPDGSTKTVDELRRAATSAEGDAFANAA